MYLSRLMESVDVKTDEQREKDIKKMIQAYKKFHGIERLKRNAFQYKEFIYQGKNIYYMFEYIREGSNGDYYITKFEILEGKVVIEELGYEREYRREFYGNEANRNILTAKAPKFNSDDKENSNFCKCRYCSGEFLENFYAGERCPNCGYFFGC